MKSISPKYVLVFLVGLVTMLGFQSVWGRLATCHQKYDLLNPVKRCSDSLVQGEWNYEPLRDVLLGMKEKWKAAGTVTHISVYFQDLDHGPRFGIGEYDKFQPASLVKVPIFIFYLHAADLDPGILEKKLSFSQALDVRDSVTSPEETIQPDTPYTIRELLRKMIVFSDNRSYLLLLNEMNVLSHQKAYDTFHDLDVLQMMLDFEKTHVSISSYAKLYAVLYNTGYLSKEMSQYALSVLSDVTFRQGIAGKLPPDLRVAHKFGFTVLEGEAQLHDCGIVYHPKMSYVLCVLTTGSDENDMNGAIADVSHAVYQTVSSLDFDQPTQERLMP